MGNVNVCDVIRRRFRSSRAYHAQHIIKTKIILKDKYNRIKTVAGLDVAYRRYSGYDIGYGVAIALSYPSFKPISCIAAIRTVCVPYIPGLLAFREMAVLAPALARLLRRASIDIIVVDGHGIAHPRRAGIASHLGVVFDIPSIGVAKKRLVGEEVKINNYFYLIDKITKEKFAIILNHGSKKIYVSPGHRISLTSAARLVKSMWIKGRIPEPTRIADSITKSLKRTYNTFKNDIIFIDCLNNKFLGKS